MTTLKQLATIVSALVVLACIALCSTASAAPFTVGDSIGVDGGSQSGVGVNYNLLEIASAPVPAGSVKRLSDGAVVDGVSITLTADIGTGIAVGSATSSFFPDAVIDDIGARVGDFSVVFSGLDPNLLYDWRSATAGFGSAGAGQPDVLVTLSGLVGGDQMLSVVRSDTAEHFFPTFQLTGSTLTATFHDSRWNNPGLNGIQLTAVGAVEAVPEPTTVAIWSLVGLGLITYGVFRRRQR
jgi:hypothetical protein